MILKRMKITIKHDDVVEFLNLDDIEIPDITGADSKLEKLTSEYTIAKNELSDLQQKWDDDVEALLTPDTEKDENHNKANDDVVEFLNLDDIEVPDITGADSKLEKQFLALFFVFVHFLIVLVFEFQLVFFFAHQHVLFLQYV